MYVISLYLELLAVALQEMMKFPHILLGKFWETDTLSIMSKGKWKFPFPLNFPDKIVHFPQISIQKLQGNFGVFAVRMLVNEADRN